MAQPHAFIDLPTTVAGQRHLLVCEAHLSPRQVPPTFHIPLSCAKKCIVLLAHNVLESRSSQQQLYHCVDCYLSNHEPHHLQPNASLSRQLVHYPSSEVVTIRQAHSSSKTHYILQQSHHPHSRRHNSRRAAHTASYPALAQPHHRHRRSALLDRHHDETKRHHCHHCHCAIHCPRPDSIRHLQTRHHCEEKHVHHVEHGQQWLE